LAYRCVRQQSKAAEGAEAPRKARLLNRELTIDALVDDKLQDTLLDLDDSSTKCPVSSHKQPEGRMRRSHTRDSIWAAAPGKLDFLHG
jgi:hypothetical protein